MLHAIWTAWSFRSWIALGMALAVLPLTVSAVAGYVLLNHGVVASFEDVAARQRYQIEPTQRLRLLMWDAVTPVDEFIDEGSPKHPPAYRVLRQRIEGEFAVVQNQMRSDPKALRLVERALKDWTAADRLATEAVSVQRAPGDAHATRLMKMFHGLIAAAVDKLGAVYDDLSTDTRADHDIALVSYERSMWLAAIAAVVSSLLVISGVFCIGRVMAVSVDRLIDGAERFAAGERDHRIEVRIPPELHNVAAEFNRMIVRIHDAENALEDLARRDGLTHLLNRRAFEEALAEAFSRLRRFGERVALLMIDIDHFKRINDTYGHSAGDHVLRAVAQTMAPDVRVFDRVFRIGGEEFAVLLFGADAAAAQVAANRLRETIAERRVQIETEEIDVTVSIGVATASEGAGANALVDAADAALYRAKSEGRNRVVVSQTGEDREQAALMLMR